MSEQQVEEPARQGNGGTEPAHHARSEAAAGTRKKSRTRLAVGLGLQELAILAHGGFVGGAKPLPETCRNELALVRSQVDAAVLVNEAANELEFLFPHWVA